MRLDLTRLVLTAGEVLANRPDKALGMLTHVLSRSIEQPGSKVTQELQPMIPVFFEVLAMKR